MDVEAIAEVEAGAEVVTVVGQVGVMLGEMPYLQVYGVEGGAVVAVVCYREFAAAAEVRLAGVEVVPAEDAVELAVWMRRLLVGGCCGRMHSSRAR